ncbi:unnamed protein product [Calicophoron daubneyi]|uniref:U-box domain-containing protein n=1 Tax=Calicophoron daubneyi TaxID=300641 RepID=A0AAV2TKW4_CALDB
MALARISLNAPPIIDETKAYLAFGKGAIKKLNRELKSEKGLIREKAAKALTDYLHDHEHIAEAVHEGVTNSLKFLLSDSRISCRAYAAECLMIMCQHALGRKAVVENGVLYEFYDLLKRSQTDTVRMNTHQALELISRIPTGAKAIAQAGFFPLLVELAQYEITPIKIYILETLKHCINMDTKRALDAGGIQIFTDLLYDFSEDVRSMAADNIYRLCILARGKQEVLEEQTIPDLVALLQDESNEVKASAAAALSVICTTNHGRYAALNCGAIPSLLELLDNENSRVRVNVLKAITSLSETPEGRSILLDHLDMIKPHENDKNANVSKHAKTAVSVITWKP